MRGQKCEHDVIRCRCKECKGSGICQHNRFKQHCKSCGSAFCEHNKEKRNCKVCSPVECDICLKKFSGKSNLRTH